MSMFFSINRNFLLTIIKYYFILAMKAVKAVTLAKISNYILALGYP